MAKSHQQARRKWVRRIEKKRGGRNTGSYSHADRKGVDGETGLKKLPKERGEGEERRKTHMCIEATDALPNW